MRNLTRIATLLVFCITGPVGAIAAGPDEPAEPASPPQFIRVEVQGKLQTGVFAIGAETTGTTITAQGVTWEIDFGGNERLRRGAKSRSGQIVLVSGTLERRRGVEIRERWIIHAESLKPPVTADGFSSIEIHQTGGFAGVDIEYRIKPDGDFVMESRRKSAKGQLDADSRAALEKAIAAVDWEDLPKELRAKNVADDFAYEITVKTDSKTHRIVIDGIAAAKAPALAKIIRITAEIQRSGPMR